MHTAIKEEDGAENGALSVVEVVLMEEMATLDEVWADIVEAWKRAEYGVAFLASIVKVIESAEKDCRIGTRREGL